MAIRPFTGSSQQTSVAQAYSPTPGFKIILAAGQSNAQGQMSVSDSSIDAYDPAIWQWPCLTSDSHYQKIMQGTDPLKWNEVGTSITGTISPATWCARAYSKMVSSPILIIPAAIGATAMHNSRWKPSLTVGAGGDLFENAVNQSNLCVAAAQAMYPGSSFDGIYWCQGEADGDLGVTKQVYSDDLSLLIQSFRSRITGAQNSWFIALSMPYETMQYYPGSVAVHYAQKSVMAATPRAKFVESSRGRTVAPGSNRHRVAAGVREMGLAIASMIPKAVAKTSPEVLTQPTPVTGVSVSSITASSAIVSWDKMQDADTYKVEYFSNSGASGVWAKATMSSAVINVQSN